MGLIVNEVSQKFTLLTNRTQRIALNETNSTRRIALNEQYSKFLFRIKCDVTYQLVTVILFRLPRKQNFS